MEERSTCLPSELGWCPELLCISRLVLLEKGSSREGTGPRDRTIWISYRVRIIRREVDGLHDKESALPG